MSNQSISYNTYKIKEFRPLMRLVDEDMSTTKLPRFEIMEEVKIISDMADYPIPKHFVTDGASVPLPVRSLFPAINKYFGAVVVHDYYCQIANATGQYCYREKADSEFYSNLIECGTNKIRAKLMSKAVIAYGRYLKLVGKLK